MFCYRTDEYKDDSIALLEAAGLNFPHHVKHGIPHETFAEYVMSSGLLLNNNLKWVAFNSAFDFAYLLKLVTSTSLPQTEVDFYKSLAMYFPVFYDVKHMRNDEGDLNSQLRNERIHRVGNAH